MIADSCLPHVRLPSLAHAAASPDLPAALGRNDDAVQVGVGLMVPLLLQVRSQPADAGASLVLRLACRLPESCAAVSSQERMPG